MPAVLKLNAALPGITDVNGLDHLAQECINHPEGTLICAVSILEVKEVRYSVAEGAHIPTVRTRRIEAWLMEDTPQVVRDALVSRQEERTGSAPLPFESLGDSEGSVGGAGDE